ncbi:MAG: hypothetical protein IT463_07910 [Planctomycetes bacterium]|nr:hypothetical protein [Planctomycetota bacterium]
MPSNHESAPWEAEGQRRQPSQRNEPVKAEKPWRMPRPQDLPEVYRPDDEGFVGGGGMTLPRPEPSPRRLDPRGKMALMVLFGAFDLGVLALALVFAVIDAEAGVIRLIYAAAAGLVALVAGAVLAIEYSRVVKYRSLNFLPAVLVYGSRDQMQKVAGPLGVQMIAAGVHQGTGTGILNRVFDRSAHLANSPETVALHVDRGGGPELIGIAWDAVRALRRGDVVWYATAGQNLLLMYHLLVPFAPRIATDAATREEVFRALRVGQSLYRDIPKSQAMGKTKVVQTDRDGNIVAGQGAQAEAGGPEPELRLSAPGAALGSSDQPEQKPADVGHDTELPGLPKGMAPQVKLRDASQGLGGQQYDPGEDDNQR